MSNAVPHGWSVQLLGKLADVRSSNVDKKSDASELPVRLCNYTDVYYRNRITSDIDFMHATAKQGEIDRFALEKGDVIITKDSETPDDIAVPALVSESLPGVICGYHLTLLRPKPDRSNGEFLAHLFQLQSVQHYFYLLANGTTRFGLTAEAINTAPLITPPLPEQQKIATILSSVDNVIEKTRAQIDKLKDLKTGMMQELLTKGIGHTEFKDSPVGRIPISWSISDMRSLCSVVTKGTTPTSLGHSYKESGINFIKVESIIRNGVIDPNKFSYIDEAANKSLARSVLYAGDILITIAGATVGKLAIVNESHLPANTNQALSIVRVNPSKANRLFLYYWLQSGYIVDQVWSIQTVGAQPNLSLAQVGEFSVPLPSIEEQNQITCQLIALDRKESLISTKLAGLVNLKKALMQDLLTGKVRVKLQKDMLKNVE